MRLVWCEVWFAYSILAEGEREYIVDIANSASDKFSTTDSPTKRFSENISNSFSSGELNVTPICCPKDLAMSFKSLFSQSAGYRILIPKAGLSYIKKFNANAALKLI